MYADAGYLSKNNTHEIVARGATPFIRPRSNTKGRPPPKTTLTSAYRGREHFYEMIESYTRHTKNWLAKYGRRNNIESAWSGVKRRFQGAVAASLPRMRRIEGALKLLAWNLTRVGRPGGF